MPFQHLTLLVPSSRQLTPTGTMAEQPPSKKSKLAEAAEAVVQAASLNDGQMTNKSLENNLNRIVQKMKSSNENFDRKINILSLNI